MSATGAPDSTLLCAQPGFHLLETTLESAQPRGRFTETRSLGLCPELLPMGTRRMARHQRSRWHISPNPGSTGHDSASPDPDMVLQTGHAAEHDAILDHTASCDPDERRDQA